MTSSSFIHPIHLVPWHNQSIGIQESKPFKRYQMLNDLTYEKVVEEAGPNHILVFVHSPQHTMKTAPFIRHKAIQQHMSAHFVKINPDVLRQETETVKNTELRHLLPFAFGIHHAAM